MVHATGVSKIEVRSFLAHVGGIQYHIARQKMLNSETPCLLIGPGVPARNGAGDTEADIRQESEASARWRPGSAVERIAQETPGRGAVVLISVEPVRLLDEALIADTCPSGRSFVLAIVNSIAAAKDSMWFHLVGEPKPGAPAVIVVVIGISVVFIRIL